MFLEANYNPLYGPRGLHSTAHFYLHNTLPFLQYLHYFFFFGALCESALPAALLLCLLVLLSFKTLDADEAAFLLVFLCFAILI